MDSNRNLYIEAYRGSTNVASSYTIYYRKKGTSTWSSTTNGQIILHLTGEWEVAMTGTMVMIVNTFLLWNYSNKDKCTDVYFEAIGTT